MSRVELDDAALERARRRQASRLLSIATAATVLECSPRTVRRRIAEGLLVARDRGRPANDSAPTGCGTPQSTGSRACTPSRRRPPRVAAREPLPASLDEMTHLGDSVASELLTMSSMNDIPINAAPHARLARSRLPPAPTLARAHASRRRRARRRLAHRDRRIRGRAQLATRPNQLHQRLHRRGRLDAAQLQLEERHEATARQRGRTPTDVNVHRHGKQWRTRWRDSNGKDPAPRSTPARPTPTISTAKSSAPRRSGRG